MNQLQQPAGIMGPILKKQQSSKDKPNYPTPPGIKQPEQKSFFGAGLPQLQQPRVSNFNQKAPASGASKDKELKQQNFGGAGSQPQ